MNVNKRCELEIQKVDLEKRMVFGFWSIVKVDGKDLEDRQKDLISTEELEKGAYKYALDARTAGDTHLRKGVGTMIESMVFTKEKCEAILKSLGGLGIDDAVLDLKVDAWWGGFYISDDEVMEKVASGEYTMFSIGGSAEQRVEVEE